MRSEDSLDEREVGEEGNEAATPAAPFFGSAKEMLDRYTHCVICGANLHFSHITDFSRNLTQETARCPECGVKIRRVLHKLQ